MNSDTIQILVTMIVYMMAVIGIGIAFAKRANKSSEDYLLGGRSLGPWVTAMSAEASDMSGWLLMGLPGVAYWCGISDSAWTAIGLAAGTYINWLITSKRLRRYSSRAGNSITLPEFFSNRFHEKGKVIMTIAALFILIFFTVYAASCLVTCGKLFSTLFGLPYIPMMIIGAVFVLVYTLLGGFLAESASDFMQAVVMIVALVVVVITGTVAAGGIGEVLDNAKNVPGFLDFFGVATPVTSADGVQQVVNGLPQFGAAGEYGIDRFLDGGHNSRLIGSAPFPLPGKRVGFSQSGNFSADGFHRRMQIPLEFPALAGRKKERFRFKRALEIIDINNVLQTVFFSFIFFQKRRQNGSAAGSGRAHHKNIVAGSVDAQTKVDGANRPFLADNFCVRAGFTEPCDCPFRNAEQNFFRG